MKGIFNSLVHGQYGLVEARVADLRYILETIPALEALAPQFKGKTDSERLVVTGHSFGAFTAQQFGGAATMDPESGHYPSTLDDRVVAVIALSPPGPMFDTITLDSWRKLSAPTLVTTGTWDIQPAFWPQWQDHLISYETSIPGEKYALVIEGADHYLGNLICRLEREGPPQEDALAMINITTTAFLDAQVKNSAEARAFLESGQLRQRSGGFAELRRRK